MVLCQFEKSYASARRRSLGEGKWSLESREPSGVPAPLTASVIIIKLLRCCLTTTVQRSEHPKDHKEEKESEG
jgi:hypothetical protein